jgi:hypothetical protein
MKTVYCIGLNVGTAEPELQLTRTLRELARGGIMHALVIGAGAWGECGERMLQVSMSVDYSSPKLFAGQLARALSQECVAMLDAGGRFWRLVDQEGIVSDGGSVSEFPLLAGVLDVPRVSAIDARIAALTCSGGTHD